MQAQRFADAQTDLSPRWSPKSYCRFSRALAHMYFLKAPYSSKIDILLSKKGLMN